MRIYIAVVSLCVLAFLIFKGAGEFVQCFAGRKNSKSGILKNIFRFVSITFMIITIFTGIVLFINGIVFSIKEKGIDVEIKAIRKL